jgi:hypothetical protein
MRRHANDTVKQIGAAMVYSCVIAAGIVGYSGSRATVHAAAPSVSIDRTLKGDRLPLAPAKAAAPDQAPAGCDPAFSPYAAPEHATVFLRCVT